MGEKVYIAPAMKKNYVKPSQKKCLEYIMQILDELKKHGLEGEEVAKDLCNVLNDSYEYKEVREGVTPEQVFKDLGNFMDNAKLAGHRRNYDSFKVSYRNPDEKEIDNIGEEVYALFQMLQDDKLEFTDEQNKIIKEIILYGFSRKETGYSGYSDLSGFKVWFDILLYQADGFSIGDRNMSINLLCANFKRFSQEDREDIILKIIDKVHNNYAIEIGDSVINGENWKENGLGYYPNKCTFDLVDYDDRYRERSGKVMSSSNAIHPLIIETLQNSTNEELIFEMFLYLKQYNKDEIPQNCISLYSDMEKLKKYITPELLRSLKRPNTEDVFEILNHLGLTITWDVAEEWFDRVLYDFDKELSVKELSEKVIQKNSVKKALNSIVENCKQGDLEKFKKYFSSKYIRELLDDKYKMPEFVNNHIDALETILDRDGGDALLQRFEELTKGKELPDSEKFHRNVFKMYLDRSPMGHEKKITKEELDKILNKIWKYIDLTTLNEKDFYHDNRIGTENLKGLLDFVEKEGLLGTPYLDNVLKGHGYPKTHGVYYMLKSKRNVSRDFLEGLLNNKHYDKFISSEEATAFIQDVYATQDDNLVKKLFDKVGEISKSCTQAEVDTLIKKMIKAISSKEDFKKFYDKMEYCYGVPGFTMFLKIKYLLTGSLHGNIREVPLDIYASLVSSGNINIKNLPKVGPSVSIDLEDLAKLHRYYDEMVEDNKKSEEKTRKESPEISEY